MRLKIAVATSLLLFTGIACNMDTDGETGADVDTEATVDEREFTLTGIVVDVEEGATPEDFEDAEATDEPEVTTADETPTATDDVDAGDEAASADLNIEGGIAVRPDDPDAVVNLDECETIEDAYITFYTQDTEGELSEADDFPDNLLGQRVTLTGVKEEEADCLLIVESVDEAAVADTDEDADGTEGVPGADTDTTEGGAGTPTPDGSPEATPFEGEDIFPAHEDTDPVFEGTPDPDECEGAKACRNEPGIGQPDDGDN